MDSNGNLDLIVFDETQKAKIGAALQALSDQLSETPVKETCNSSSQPHLNQRQYITDEKDGQLKVNCSGGENIIDLVESDVEDNEDQIDEQEFVIFDYKKYVLYICPECGIECGPFSKWKSHTEKIHKANTIAWLNLSSVDDDDGDPYYQCRDCNKRLSIRAGPELLRAHRTKHLAHTYYLKCKPCGKRFQTFSNISRHLKEHCKKFTRPDLNKKYVDYNMKYIKIFCPVCGEQQIDTKFWWDHLIDKHDYEKKIESQVTQLTRFTFSCRLCRKKIFKDSIRSHMLAHEDNKSFQCSLCGKYQTSKTRAVEHMRRRHMLFQCEFCKSKFSKKYMLSKHINNCQKNMKSTICDNSFSNKNGLLLQHAHHTIDLTCENFLTKDETLGEESFSKFSKQPCNQEGFNAKNNFGIGDFLTVKKTSCTANRSDSTYISDEEYEFSKKITRTNKFGEEDFNFGKNYENDVDLIDFNAEKIQNINNSNDKPMDIQNIDNKNFTLSINSCSDKCGYQDKQDTHHDIKKESINMQYFTDEKMEFSKNDCSYGNEDNNETDSQNEEHRPNMDIEQNYKLFIEYICPECGLNCGSFTKWKLHTYIPHQSNAIAWLNLNTIINEGGESYYQCRDCNQLLSLILSFRDLRAHCLQHLSDKLLKCRFCDLRFQATKSICEHIKLSHSELACQYLKDNHSNPCISYLKIFCPICQQTMSNVKLWWQHLIDEHDYENKIKSKSRQLGKKYSCLQCEKKIHEKSIKSHMLIHEANKSFQCTLCGKYSSQLTIALNHVSNVHFYNEFKNECYYCHITFGKKSMLFNHYRTIHKNIICTVCGENSENALEFFLHVKSAHRCSPFLAE